MENKQTSEHIFEQPEVKQILDFIKQYGKTMGIGLLALIAIIFASKGLASQKAGKITQAEELLLQAKAPQQLEEIVNNYKSTPAASVALLDLAKTHFNNGDYTQARAQYERFLKDYKKNELTPIALFGLANCSEADGDFDRAIAQFTEFLKEQAGHYLQAPATLALARSMQQADRSDDARIVLEGFLLKNASTHWAGSAEAALDELDKK